MQGAGVKDKARRGGIDERFAIEMLIGYHFHRINSNGLGKILNREVISEKYSLEYGIDIMEMHVGAVEPGERALLSDDLIATGGTLCAAIRLLE
ncbi:hypothetical protein IFM89_038738 [Coptis chinensis]|uniref:adenine phosphoribosyltransferase n=1 Tax=Coptis chinensis TaxID=261450 RepID=A0A835HMA9_9MAGN|nr:hypothetical protein IFM89_038738 [Coptis chinensis]